MIGFYPTVLLVSVSMSIPVCLLASPAVASSGEPAAPRQRIAGSPSDNGSFAVYERSVKVPAAPDEDATIYAPSHDGGKTMVANGHFPLVIVLPGFLAHYSYYEQMTRHLVSWGFVVLGIDFAKPSDHAGSAKQVQRTIDWALSAANPAASIIDRDKIAIAGHSLGGKIAVYASSGDANTKYPAINFAGAPRIKVIIAWDPVDSGGPPCAIAEGDAPGQCRGNPVLPENIRRSGAKMLIFGGITGDPKRLTCTPRGRTHANFYANAPSSAMHVEFPKSGHVDWVAQNTWFGLLPFLGNLFCGDHPSADPLKVQAIAKRTQLVWLLKNFGNYDDLDQYLTGAVIQSDCKKNDLCKIEQK
ncbi:MAG: hypothetical protein FJ146_08125 [Deltaproteobacteria bacterium]|nr:hypothetical protein [Deltaproteobacteria bacterium]